MKKYCLEFIKRGLTFSGLGPVVLGIVYFILGRAIEGFSLSGGEVLVAIVSTYFLAFLQAGASVFNQIDEWHLSKSLLFHFLTVYTAYLVCYLVNSWIPFSISFVLIFTGIFIAVYLAIWFSVYLIVKNVSKKFNAAIEKE